MASQIRRKPQLTYKSPSAGDHSFFILSLAPLSKNSSTAALPCSSAEPSQSRQQTIDLHKRFARRKYPMSPPLPLFHPFGRLAMSLPPLDPTLFGLPMRAVSDEVFQPKSSARSRRPTAKLREVEDLPIAPTVSTIAAVAAREVKERPSPRKRRPGAAKRKRKDTDDGDATYPAKRTRMPRGTVGQNVEEESMEAVQLNDSSSIPENLSDLVENTKRRSARSRASTKRRDSSASETTSISPSTNIFATSGVDLSTNDVDVEETSHKSFVVQFDDKEEREEGELSEEQINS
ncbi:hypothetical protein BYT27DRAFT_7220018 [Phlegmacium glaucopus]|nr:hypothetical protein BYT27DRAFT_7220018 [Phlegmacium glaucopus]